MENKFIVTRSLLLVTRYLLKTKTGNQERATNPKSAFRIYKAPDDLTEKERVEYDG